MPQEIFVQLQVDTVLAWLLSKAESALQASASAFSGWTELRALARAIERAGESPEPAQPKLGLQAGARLPLRGRAAPACSQQRQAYAPVESWPAAAGRRSQSPESERAYPVFRPISGASIRCTGTSTRLSPRLPGAPRLPGGSKYG